MSKSISRIRQAAAIRQQYRCFYCGCPMWDKRPDAFISKYGVSRKQAAMLRCTAEHLKEKCAGGTNSSANIVAACLYCNQKRHARRFALDSLEYKALVQKRIAKSRWYIESFPDAIKSL